MNRPGRPCLPAAVSDDGVPLPAERPQLERCVAALGLERLLACPLFHNRTLLVQTTGASAAGTSGVLPRPGLCLLPSTHKQPPLPLQAWRRWSCGGTPCTPYLGLKRSWYRWQGSRARRPAAA